MDGRSELALAQAQRLAERGAKGKSINAEFMRGVPLLTLVRLERWDQVLRQDAMAGDAGLAAPITQYARGVALARTGQLGAARTAATALHGALDAPVLVGKGVMGDDPARSVLAILDARLRAEIAAAEGDLPAASKELQQGIELEAALEANEPPLLGDGSRLALGDLMLRQRRWADAETAFRADLVDHPGSGWALRGLQQALAGQGKAEAAGQAQRELARAWWAADPTLRAGSGL
jgi:hypothetical protein